MLEKPKLDDDKLSAHLQRVYDLTLARLEFLPLGADCNTAVYRAIADSGTPYFVRLRQGTFDKASVTLSHFFGEHGLRHIITPLMTKTGGLWSPLETFTVVLYPFITGQSGYAVSLTEENWREFGRTLKRLHTLAIPSVFTRQLRQETYDAGARDAVKTFLTQLEPDAFDDALARKTASFMRDNRTELWTGTILFLHLKSAT